MKTKLVTKNIKTILFFSAILFLSKISKAQDTIVQTNGTRIIAVVQEVGTTEIKYKKYSNRETSPVYTIAKDQVSMIKYADGTKDVFNQGSTGTKPSPPVPPTPPVNPPPVPPTPIENKNTLNNNGKTSKLQYIYFGLRTSIINNYDGGGFDNYWTNLFSNEVASGGDGATQLDEGSPSYKELVIGLSFQLSDKNILNFESQDVISNSHALYNTAVFLDGTNGDMNFNLFSTSIAGQFLHCVGPTNNIQIGGELGVEYGMLFGSETDNFATYTSTIISVDRTYSGSGLGVHFALVGKYFFGTKKMFGAEIRAGYRTLTTTASSSFGYSTNTAVYPDNESMSIGWSGAFVTAGIVVQIKKKFKN